VLADDFTGKTLRPVWTTYSGQPGGDPAGWWEPSHVVVEDSQLRLRTYREGGRWVSGGVGAWRGDGLTYGKVEMRMRAPKAHGVSYAMLLWPVSGRWPIDGEIDFAEDGGGDRSGTSATLHFGANNREFTRTVDANFSDWQTIGVEWTPGKLVYTLNGKPWGTVNSDHVPDKRMVLALQSQVWGCHIVGYKCPDASTPATSSIDVDWVVAYERAAG
jgi:beta-glucanase (GH16 family)